jgi:hypothetical protein
MSHMLIYPIENSVLAVLTVLLTEARVFASKLDNARTEAQPATKNSNKRINCRLIQRKGIGYRLSINEGNINQPFKLIRAS